MHINYKPGIGLKFADALSHLYIHCIVSTDVTNQDWPLIVIYTKEEWFPSHINEATKAKVQ